jgi:hypothetical protein
LTRRKLSRAFWDSNKQRKIESNPKKEKRGVYGKIREARAFLLQNNHKLGLEPALESGTERNRLQLRTWVPIPTEITRIITECLEVLQGRWLTKQMLHRLRGSAPWSPNGMRSRAWKDGHERNCQGNPTGRKFGLGCLVITQRTNITKSILNQCNTVFGLRVFDATGMEFLKNYIGEDYAGVLSTLEDRHAVVFGRASSCRDPVLTRLNDRTDFIRAFREPKPSSESTRVNT